jgi:hypothetical protein
MRKELIDDLLRYAQHLSDPQHATLAAVLREAADELEQRHAPDLPSDPTPAISSPVIDDGRPHFRSTCLSCWDDE